MLQVNLHRLLADAQCACDFLVRMPHHALLKYTILLRSERFEVRYGMGFAKLID
jgi:hypothetical protein